MPVARLAAAAAPAISGFLHMTAAGAVVLAGLRLAFPDLGLALPDVLPLRDPVDALAGVLAFGLSCLRVPVETAELRFSAAPLTGLAVTLWAIASATRSTAASSATGGSGDTLPSAGPAGATRAERPAPTQGAAATRRGEASVGVPAAPRVAGLPLAAGVALVFAVLCVGAAVAVPALGSPLRPSVLGSAVAGLAWGWLAAAVGLRLRDRRLPNGRSRELLRPGLTMAAVAGVAGAVAVVALLGARLLGGVSLGALTGGALLATAFAPNLVVLAIALGTGAPVDAGFGASDAFAGTSGGRVALWEWNAGGAAPWYVVALVLVPVVAAVAAARVTRPGSHDADPQSRRLPRLRAAVVTGAVFAALVVFSG
ncbi:MAG: hypothetical protein M3273_10130, partial [Actinomycetota bacterium]|nr:hypothetical protein [Actinomycetota bacterium]